MLAVSSGSTLEAVRRAGAHEVLDRAPGVVEQARTAAPDGVDAVLDVVAGDLVAEGLSCCARGQMGRRRRSRRTRRRVRRAPPLPPQRPDHRIEHHTPAHVDLLADIARRAPVRPVIARTHPLDQAFRAQEELGRRRRVGTIVPLPGRPRPGRDRPVGSGLPGPPGGEQGGPGSPSRRVRPREAPGGRPPGGEADARGGRAVRRAAAAVECSARSPA
ncbi:zinc-binding dehydrogenase [Thermobifida alba]|uniref:zinc-binding dehydrogenase n=1 Tax=Thermobifida alba TaxID=53522 RepID=UPI0020BF5948|nr:zinc-binding dehydrogenase [Thermobifida alba]